MILPPNSAGQKIKIVAPVKTKKTTTGPPLKFLIKFLSNAIILYYIL